MVRRVAILLGFVLFPVIANLLLQSWFPDFRDWWIAFASGVIFLALALFVDANRRARDERRRPGDLEDPVRTALKPVAESLRKEFLGHDLDEIELQFSFRGEHGEYELGDIGQIISSKHRVILLGGSGSGKTVAANLLQLELLREATSGPIRPSPSQVISHLIPLVMSLSKWTDTQLSIEGQISLELANQTGIDRDTAAAMVRDGRVMPILDGLDEMDADVSAGRANALLGELRRYRRFDRPAPFVLICRTDKWDGFIATDAVGSDVHVIELLPPSVAQILKYLDAISIHSPGVRSLRSFVARNASGELAPVLRKPWSVTAAIEFSNVSSPSHDEWRELLEAWETPPVLLGAYVASRLKSIRAKRGARVDPARLARAEVRDLRQVKAYARYLVTNEREKREVGHKPLPYRDLTIHELWPMNGRVRARIADALLAVVVSVPGMVWLAWLLLSQGSAFAVIVLFCFVLVYVGMLTHKSLTPWVAVRQVRIRIIASGINGVFQIIAALASAVVTLIVFGWLAAAIMLPTAFVVVGLTVGFGQTLSGAQDVAVASPQTPLRREFVISIAAAAAVIPLLSLGFAQLPWLSNCVAAVSAATIYSAIAGMTVASAPLRRYIAYVISSTGRRRTSRAKFLAESERVGLMRPAGISYQFRHDELRKYLGAL